jgi:ketosteroid isomerase-like protein
MKTLIAALLVALPLSAGRSQSGPTDADAEKEVMTAMEAWRYAMTRRDAATLERLYHTDLTFGHSNGQVETKAEAIQHALTSKAAYAAIEFADLKIRLHQNLALVTGNLHVTQVTDGKSSEVPLVALYVWVRGPQGWQLIGRQSTRKISLLPRVPPWIGDRRSNESYDLAVRGRATRRS